MIKDIIIISFGRTRVVTATENTFCNTLWRGIHYQPGDADAQTAFEVLQNVGGEASVVCKPKNGIGIGRTTKRGDVDTQTAFEVLQSEFCLDL